MTKDIRTALRNYEPRAIIDDVKVKSLPDKNSLNVTIIFRVRNVQTPFRVNVLLERIR